MFKNKYWLRLIIFFLIGAQACVVLDEYNVVSVLFILVSVLIALFYIQKTKRPNAVGLIAFVFFVFGTSSSYLIIDNALIVKVFSFMISYAILSYFCYQNSKAFDFSKRDIVTILLGSGLYTLVFVLMCITLRDLMGVLTIGIFIYLIILHFLLIIAGMHYVNIRSEKSMCFFLMMLCFVLSDFCYLLDHFYITAKELQLLYALYNPVALYFFVSYLTASELSLKSDTLESF